MDNNNIEHVFKLQNSKLEAKNKKESKSSNTLDNDTMKHECEL